MDVLQTVAAQQVAIQKQLTALQTYLTSRNTGGTRCVIFGIKNITSEQMLDAYQRGMNLEQLYELANGKYTREQIYKKISRMTGGAV